MSKVALGRDGMEPTWERVNLSRNTQKQRYAEILFPLLFPALFTVSDKKAITAVIKPTESLGGCYLYMQIFSMVYLSIHQ